MRVVLDTNVIVSRVIFDKGAPARILKLGRAGAFTLLISEPILAEYRRALSYKDVRARHCFSVQDVAREIRSLRESAVTVQATEHVRVVRDDPKDDIFLECALAGGADYIVSGDSHLLALREFRGVRILSPAVFLAVLEYEGRQGARLGRSAERP